MVPLKLVLKSQTGTLRPLQNMLFKSYMILLLEELITSVSADLTYFSCSSVPQDGRRQKGCWTTTGNMATHLKVAVFWLKRPKSKQPKCRSFESIKEAVEDELTTAKPSFFVYQWSFNLFWQNTKLSHQWFHICVLILWSLSEVWCRLQWSTTL